jgi:predicted metalloprotease with PDZ domain
MSTRPQGSMTEGVGITYTVSSLEPNSHRAHFTIELRSIGAPAVDIVLPVWAPGAYEIRESAREVREVSARALEGSQPLQVERIEKNRWRVSTVGIDSCVVAYTVYGHELLDDGFDVTDEHLFLNATRCLPYVVGRENEPLELVLHLPPGWRAYAELPRTADLPPRFRARDYEELVDTPVDCGTPQELEFLAGGIPHRLVICGSGGNYETHQIETDTAKIVEAQIRYFGGSPLHSFTFFLHVTDRRDGGLEHKNSTSLVLERNSFRPAEAYERFLSVVSHEYFHVYNVKRIRPKVLGPFDFTRENYTRLLWWMEGTTDYASHLLLRRAGLLTPRKYLGELAKLAHQYLTMPGRAVRSLEEASLSAWVDLYRPYEESRNQSVSYYIKGHLVSLCLDLEIRSRSGNLSSLDHVFRHLWKEYGVPDRGLEEGEIYRVVDSVTGLDLKDFFGRYVRGTDELDLDQFVRHAGLGFSPAPKSPEDAETPEAGYFGFEFANEGGRVRVREVLDHTPARRAGISPGDELVAFDGTRVLHEGFTDSLKRYPPGTEVQVDLFRRGRLRKLTVMLGKPPPAKYVFRPVEQPTPLQRLIYESWLESAWTPAPAGGTGEKTA